MFPTDEDQALSKDCYSSFNNIVNGRVTMVYYLKNGHWREMKKTRLAEKLWSYPVKNEVLLNSRTNMERTTVPSCTISRATLEKF